MAGQRGLLIFLIVLFCGSWVGPAEACLSCIRKCISKEFGRSEDSCPCSKNTIPECRCCGRSCAELYPSRCPPPCPLVPPQYHAQYMAGANLAASPCCSTNYQASLKSGLPSEFEISAKPFLHAFLKASTKPIVEAVLEASGKANLQSGLQLGTPSIFQNLPRYLYQAGGQPVLQISPQGIFQTSPQSFLPGGLQFGLQSPQLSTCGSYPGGQPCSPYSPFGSSYPCLSHPSCPSGHSGLPYPSCSPGHSGLPYPSCSPGHSGLPYPSCSSGCSCPPHGSSPSSHCCSPYPSCPIIKSCPTVVIEGDKTVKSPTARHYTPKPISFRNYLNDEDDDDELPRRYYPTARAYSPSDKRKYVPRDGARSLPSVTLDGKCPCQSSKLVCRWETADY